MPRSFQLPWPGTVFLNRADDPTQLAIWAARVRRGEAGTRHDWARADDRWSRASFSLQEAIEADEWDLPVVASIGTKGFPAAMILHEFSSDPTADVRARPGEMLMRHLRVFSSSKSQAMHSLEQIELGVETDAAPEQLLADVYQLVLDDPVRPKSLVSMDAIGQRLSLTTLSESEDDPLRWTSLPERLARLLGTLIEHESITPGLLRFFLRTTTDVRIWLFHLPQISKWAQDENIAQWEESTAICLSPALCRRIHPDEKTLIIDAICRRIRISSALAEIILRDAIDQCSLDEATKIVRHLHKVIAPEAQWSVVKAARLLLSRQLTGLEATSSNDAQSPVIYLNTILDDSDKRPREIFTGE